MLDLCHSSIFMRRIATLWLLTVEHTLFVVVVEHLVRCDDYDRVNGRSKREFFSFLV